jgi:hypothetical protein
MSAYFAASFRVFFSPPPPMRIGGCGVVSACGTFNMRSAWICVDSNPDSRHRRRDVRRVAAGVPDRPWYVPGRGRWGVGNGTGGRIGDVTDRADHRRPIPRPARCHRCGAHGVALVSSGCSRPICGPTLWVMCVMSGPGASISLALLFMVLRSTSTTQTSQVSGMAQSVGYILAAAGPVAIGALHDVTGSWTIAMSALVPQAVSTVVAGRNVTMSRS